MKHLTVIGIVLCLAAFLACSAIGLWHRLHDRVVSTTELSNFTIDQTAGTVTDVPWWIRRLDGQHVAVIGDIWQPVGDGNTMRKFELANMSGRSDPWGIPPLAQEFVRCHAATPLTYHDEMVRVSGTFHVHAVYDSGKLANIFTLDADELSLARQPFAWDWLRWWWLATAGGLSVVLILARLYGWLQERRRVRQHLCATCGYDLRASPGRCPECGGVAHIEPAWNVDV